MKEQIREAFENIQSSHGLFPRAITRSGDGYLLSQTQGAWTTWQQAWQAALDSLEVKLSAVPAQQPAKERKIKVIGHFVINGSEQ
jgi:hypothetical protein